MLHTRVHATGHGVRIHLHHFRDERAAPSGLTLLLLHGYMDAGGTWDLVAPHLAGAGHNVLAPDFRGFGASDPVGAGGYYHFPDYVADVAALVTSLLAPQDRLGIVGHSMGGTVASLYAGARPDRVERLALLEGLGPPSMDADLGVDRMAAWLRDMERISSNARAPRVLASMDEALQRLQVNHPRVPIDVLRSRAAWLTRRDEKGQLVWAYDPLHRTTSPATFVADQLKAFLRKITCPTLFVGGGPLGYHPPDEADRLTAIRDLAIADLPNAGHMMHWTEPYLLGEMLVRFFGAPRPSSDRTTPQAS